MNATGKRAKAFYGTPKEFKFYFLIPGGVATYRGMRNRLEDFLKKMEIPYETEEKFIEIPLNVAEKIGETSQNRSGEEFS